jgi:hypothetical protein
LSKLGGSPSNLERMLIDQTNEEIYSKDPMVKIKGSKASLQHQFFSNLNKPIISEKSHEE